MMDSDVDKRPFAEPTDLAPPNHWSDPEQRLWSSFRRGQELNLHGVNPVTTNVAGPDHWGPDKTIRAEVLASLLLHSPPQEPGRPNRLILSGARISGRLDLGCSKVAPFSLINCLLEEEPILNDASAEFVGFTSCLLPGLSAVRMTCNGPVWVTRCKIAGNVDLEDANITGDAVFRETSFETSSRQFSIDLGGARIASDLALDRINANQAIHFHNASISGDITFTGATMNCPGEWAISGKQAVVGGSIFFTKNFRCNGAVNLEGAKVDGQVVLVGAQILRPDDIALDLDHISIRLGAKADRARFEGTIRLHHAHIGCQLSLSEAQIIRCGGKKAILADHMIVDGSVEMEGGFRSEGLIHMHGAKIECNLSLAESRVLTDKGPAFTLDAATIGGALFANNCELQGYLDLEGATIIGPVSLKAAKLTTNSSLALDLRRADARGGIFATEGFSAQGMISLADAKVAVGIDFSDARITHSRKKALDSAGLSLTGNFVCNRIEVDGLVDLAAAAIDGDVRFADATLTGVPLEEASRGTEIDPFRGGDWRGASLRATASKVSGDFNLRGARFTQSLVLDSATVQRAVHLDSSRLEGEESTALAARFFHAAMLSLRLKTRPTGAVLLTSATIGTIVDDANSWPEEAPIALDGLRYESIDTELTIKDRLRILRQATPSYTPHPYEQLASQLSASGQDDDARKVRLAAIRRSYEASRLPIRAWGKTQDVVVGYGYAPFRALLIFLVLFAGSALWFTFAPLACDDPGMEDLPLCPIKSNEHPTWDAWLYSADLLIPLVNLGHENSWDPTGISKMVTSVLIIAGWILTTTIVAAAGRSLRGRS
ncbi:hypothetical protein [Micromonospora echinofusca]|uniref:Pentapeptide repeat-containing protein n=1 Tax=Micromonospora echinofusca TaxID=47858 RepID=A0ABS3VP15_MICEH|nr:hypothetical protein [Micromonospora echinofusca]MBO4206148.1 hypothetical protein [Micromonospora echinofusca]